MVEFKSLKIYISSDKVVPEMQLGVGHIHWTGLILLVKEIPGDTRGYKYLRVTDKDTTLL